MKLDRIFSEKNRIFVFCFLSFFITYPPMFSSTALVVFLLFHFFVNRPNKIDFLVLVPCAFYFILLYSYLYTQNEDKALGYLIKGISIILLPFSILKTKKLDYIDVERIKKNYCFGVFFLCLACVLCACFDYLFVHRDLSVFFYLRYADFVGLHPTYFGMFILMALIIWRNTFLNKKVFNFIFIAVCLTTIILLQSRVIYIMTILFFIYSAILLKKRFLFLLILPFLIMLVYNRDNFNPQFTIFEEAELIGNNKSSGITQRVWLWRNAFEAIIEKPIFGYGLASQNPLFEWKIQKKLLEKNNDRNYELASKYYSKYNFHNQYLQIAYENGIVGLLIFVSMIVVMYYIAIRRKKRDMIMYLILISVVMFSENILSRHMGIYFCSFFSTLFLFTHNLND